MASSGKDGKEKKGGKEESATAGSIRRLTEEMAALRADVAAMQNAAPQRILDAAHRGASDRVDASAAGTVEDMLVVEDNAVAKLGYAFSSGAKIAIVRAMLREGAQSAAQIGEKTGLTTGSLYHHLRELVHARVLETSGTRSPFTLTQSGRRIAEFLFVEARSARDG